MSRNSIAGFAQNAPGGQRPTRVRYLVLVALATAAVHSYLTRVCISPAATTIQCDLDLSDIQLGRILSAFFVGYILSQIPGGWLGQRFGPRALLALLCLLWSAFTVWSAHVQTFEWLWVSRMAIGLAQGGLFPITALVILSWFPEQERGLASSIPTGFMSVGSIAANGLTGLLLRWMSWRRLFEGFAAAGFVWSVAFYLWYRNRPEQHRATNKAECLLIEGVTEPLEERNAAQVAPAAALTPATEPGAPSWWEITQIMAQSLSMWTLCIQSFFRAFGYAFFITWFPPYLERTYHIEPASAGLLTMLPLTGVVLGSFAGGFVVDSILARTGSKWWSRSGLSFLSLALCALATLAACALPSALPAVLLIAAGAFCFGFTGPTTWAATIDIGGQHSGVVFAIMNIAGNVGAILSPETVGHLIDYLRRVQGDPGWILVMLAAIYACAALAWFWLDPNQSAVDRRVVPHPQH